MMMNPKKRMNQKKRMNPMKPNTLTSDVLELFDCNRITMNSLRKFVVESVADFIGDDKHDKVCGKLFDR